MKLSDFNYNLPEKYIAQTPIEPRDHSKLMILHKNTGKIEHKHFYDIIDYLDSNDVLVLNNTKVMAAKMFGHKSTGAKVEILLLNKRGERLWEVLAKPAKRLKKNEEIFFNQIKARIREVLDEGRRVIEFDNDEIDKIGTVPLPPYIKCIEPSVFATRYQTIYAKIMGSAAAPTAGLHFTAQLINKLKKKGVIFEEATLHIGLDTFLPIREKNIRHHKIHKEYCHLSLKNAQALNFYRKQGKRIVAAGTTTARILESAVDKNGRFNFYEGWTDIFIYPGYKFKAVDGLITNFHLPKSTLLLLVSAFASREFILKAYNEAKKHHYRFFSFGDAMLII